MVTEPAEIFMPSTDDTCVAEWKLLRQYIAPLFGVRYVSEYQADDLRPENERAYDVDPTAAGKTPWRGAGQENEHAIVPKAPETKYNIRTKIHTMRSRYISFSAQHHIAQRQQHTAQGQNHTSTVTP
jgi:hypothetical protein